MPITVEQAIKVGFLMKCAEDGLTMHETHTRVKQAIAQFKAGANVAGIDKIAFIPQLINGISALGTGAGKTLGALASVVPALGTAGIAAGVGVPVAAGAATGYLASKLTGGNSSDVLDDAKQDEVVSEYQRLADEAKRRALLKRIQAETGRRIIPLSPSLGVA